jgi:hypothetical protein
MGAPGAAAAPHAEPPLPADLAPAGDLPLLPPLASDLTPPVLVTDEQHAQYANDGYTFFPSLIDREAVAELRHAVDQMVEHAVGDFSFEPSDPSLIQRITGPHRHSRVFAELTRNEALCGAIAQIIGPSFRHNNIKLNFKPPRVGSAVEWHQDWAFYPHTNGSVLAAGIFLDDVDEENGCELSRSLPSRPLARSLPTLRARCVTRRPTMVIPGSHRGPVYDHHTDGLFVGGMDVVAGTAAGCDFASAAKLCGPAGSVSVHHVRAVHGSDHNRSDRPRRLLFIECVAADAWPLLGCPEFGETPVGEGAFDSLGSAQNGGLWWHHLPMIFDASAVSLRSAEPAATAAGEEQVLQLSLPETDGRGTPVMGRGVSDTPRLEDGVPVRMPLPRASAEGLPGGGIYALHTTLKNKAFGDPEGVTRTAPKL